jgi:RNA polymerase sigma-70 factor (ECF subfamily)
VGRTVIDGRDAMGNSLTIMPMPQRPWSRDRATRGEELLVHADPLYNLARYLTRDPGEADDLVQETYARALRGWSDFAPGTNLKAWLFRILRNTFITRYRQEQRHPTPEPYDTIEQPGDEAPDQSAPPAAVQPEQLRRVISSDIEAALRTLSEDARTAILLDVEGFTESEAALVLGCAVGTVKSRLNRARAALRLKLAEYSTRDRP